MLLGGIFRKRLLTPSADGLLGLQQSSGLSTAHLQHLGSAVVDLHAADGTGITSVGLVSGPGNHQYHRHHMPLFGAQTTAQLVPL